MIPVKISINRTVSTGQHWSRKWFLVLTNDL
jgi:hypothetical protein